MMKLMRKETFLFFGRCVTVLHLFPNPNDQSFFLFYMPQLPNQIPILFMSFSTFIFYTKKVMNWIWRKKNEPQREKLCQKLTGTTNLVCKNNELLWSFNRTQSGYFYTFMWDKKRLCMQLKIMLKYQKINWVVFIPNEQNEYKSLLWLRDKSYW